MCGAILRSHHIVLQKAKGEEGVQTSVNVTPAATGAGGGSEVCWDEKNWKRFSGATQAAWWKHVSSLTFGLSVVFQLSSSGRKRVTLLGLECACATEKVSATKPLLHSFVFYSLSRTSAHYSWSYLNQVPWSLRSYAHHCSVAEDRNVFQLKSLLANSMRAMCLQNEERIIFVYVQLQDKNFVDIFFVRRIFTSS